MNWLLFAFALGGLYLIVFGILLHRRGWSAAAFLAGIFHLMFATINSAAPFRALLDGMYMGWGLGLLRFNGRSAVVPSAIVLVWALMSVWVCGWRPQGRWPRVMLWGDVFWAVNFLALMGMMFASGQLGSAKFQLGEYFEISGPWVALVLFLLLPMNFGLSALWAWRYSQRRLGPAA
jgi:hypothetical protein